MTRMTLLHQEPEEINPDEELEDTCDNKEDDLGAVEEQRSVILHLLSQLKLGMDLTRVSDWGLEAGCAKSEMPPQVCPPVGCVGSFATSWQLTLHPDQQDWSEKLDACQWIKGTCLTYHPKP